ncbi:MAG: TRAP transporter large permease [Desulfovibrio sp.]|jgi:C4-dicarboxylate transporter DctM subunit|nr:TRAP transporter large permease [Desulfovibrio sp.]
MIAFILFSVFLVLLIISAPIAVALGLSSVVALIVEGTVPLTVVVQKIFAANNSFPLLAVPFFMFAGAVMTEGGISHRLINFVYALVSGIRGGLAMVATLTAMFFAAISGSSAATTAAIGASIIPAMQQKGYNEEFSAAVIAAAGTTGIVIPPSTPLVIFGVVAGVSIGDLFLGGLIPGILMGLAMMAVIYVQASRRQYTADNNSGKPRNTWKVFRDASWGLMMPVIILGGIYGGIFTPTESAVIASFYGLFVTMFVYRSITLRDIPRITGKAVLQTAMIMFIISMANVFAWLLTANRIPQEIAAYLLSITEKPLYIMLLINILLLWIGTFLNATAAISILVPVLMPVITKVGIDQVAFGVIMTVNLAIGCITPPVGVDLFVAQGVTGISIERITRAIMPYMMALICVLALITIFPDIILFLPNMMTGK